MTDKYNPPEYPDPEKLEQRMAFVAEIAAQQSPDHWAPGDPTRETPEQIMVRLRLDPEDIQTPALVSRQIRHQQARSEEKRWTDLEARVTALEALAEGGKP